MTPAPTRKSVDNALLVYSVSTQHQNHSIVLRHALLIHMLIYPQKYVCHNVIHLILTQTTLPIHVNPYNFPLYNKTIKKEL
jgi:hypothetical protein